MRVGVLILIVILSLTACKEESPTREELLEDVVFLSSEVAWFEATLEEVEIDLDAARDELKRVQGVLMEPERVRITELADGTGRTSFMLGDDGELVFPNELYLEGVTAMPNTARIMLGADVSIIPAGSWVTNVQGTTVHYSHSNGIRGVTRVGANEFNADYDLMMGAMENFFGDFPTASVVYSDVFISGALRGIHARASTLVEEESHVVHAFVISSHRVNVLGTFDFAQSTIREELVTQLISSLAWAGIRIHIEN
jgi:hypothetical protein